MDTTNVAAAAPAESAPALDQPTAPATDAGNGAPPADGQQPDNSGEQSKPREPSRLQKRIDEITRQRYEEQRAREAAEAKLAQYERQQKLAREFQEIEAGQPRIEQYQDLHSYQMAMADWTTRRATAIASAQWEERMAEQATQYAQLQQRAMAEQQRQIQQNAQLEAKMSDGAKKYPDFIAAITNPELPSVRGTPLFDAVLQADNAVDIAYSLAKNPAELDRLLSIRDPLTIAREVFRLDSKFSGNAATAAPPPPPSRNGSSPAPSGPPDPKDTAAWMAWRERDLKEKARHR